MFLIRFYFNERNALIMKKFIVLALTIVFYMFFLNTSILAINGPIAEYYWNVDDSQGLNCWMDSTPIIYNYMDKNGWAIDTMGNSNLYVDIEDSALYGISDYTNVFIDITYFDNGLGYFYIKYDGCSGETIFNDYIELYNSQQWITKTIRIEDAYFANRANNADFVITAVKTEQDRVFAISDIRLIVSNTKSYIRVKATSNPAGNIFFDGESKTFSIEFENKSLAHQDFIATYQIKNYDSDDACYSTVRNYSISSGSKITDTFSIPDAIKYGVYNLSIILSSQDNILNAVYDIPFSICRTNPYGLVNEKIGIVTHFSWGRESKAGTEIIKKAGFSYIRDGYKWADFERKKGIYSEPSVYTEYLQNVVNNDLNILIVAAYGNPVYGMTSGGSAHQQLPETDEEMNAFAEYVYEMLKARNGNIDVVEIWNEPDLTAFNKTNVPPEVYTKLLKVVYERVKPHYPNVKIGAMAIANSLTSNGYSWLQRALAADLDGDGVGDAHKYFDIFTFHHYTTNLSSLPGILNNFLSLLDIYNCSDKEIWHTEYGSTRINVNKSTLAYDLRSPEEQAIRLSQYYTTLHANNLGDKFFIYDFSNDGLAENDSEYNFGIVESHMYKVPYAAKPAFIAMANINALLAGTSKAQVIYHQGGIVVHKYKDTKRRREVYVFYSESGLKSYNFEFGDGTVKFYDMYGNECNFDNDGKTYNLVFDRKPIYAEVFPENTTEITFAKVEGGIHVEGLIKTGRSGDFVGVEVYSDEGEMIYLDQFELNSEKKFSFNFQTDFYGEYAVYIGSDSLGEVQVFYFDASDKFQASIKAYTKNKKVLGMEDVNNEDVDIVIFVNDESIVERFKIFYAIYKSNVMQNVTILNLSDLVGVGSEYQFTLEPSLFHDADVIKVFLWDSFHGMIPLARHLAIQ